MSIQKPSAIAHISINSFLSASKEIIKHEWITLVKTKHEIQQIDFKGLDHGRVQIDWLKLYKEID